MPAQSKQQQKFMGLVHAIQKGDVPASDASPQAQKVAKEMDPKDVKDFASTSHKGLPRKVKQEILKKLKEYAMTLPGHHSKYAAPMDSLRSDDEMDIQETRIPQNFNVGTTQDYHTKLATTPRKKYDKTNLKPQDSGQPDLEDDEVNESFNELEHLKLLNLAMKAIPGSPKQKEIIKKLNQVRIAGGMKPIKESSIIEYASNLDNSYILNKDAEIKEENPCWDGYKQVGMKTKGGKQVPNCVKESVNESAVDKLRTAVQNINKKYQVKISTHPVTKGEIEIILGRGNHPDSVYHSIEKLVSKLGIKRGEYTILDESVNESSKEDIIKDLDKAKNDLLKKVDILIAKKKKLYSNVDIESPMTTDEKKLDKDIADLFSQINKLVLQKRNLKEELSFNEREMVIGIIEILKQVEDRKNRMKIALNMLKKFKEEGIEFDYQKFIDHLKEYSMGSYEYDKGNRELGEAMIMQAKDVIYKVVPKSTFARFASDPKKNREFVDSIVRDLTYLLNRFYKQNNIDLTLK